MKNYEQSIKDFNPYLYSFAHVLIPDALQARQIVIDAFEKLHLEGKLGEYLELNRPGKSKLKIALLKSAYELSIKRAQHLFNGIEGSEEVKNFGEFYRLEFAERAIVWLKVRLKLDFSSIQEITDLDRYEVMTFIARARDSLIRTQGREGVKLPEVGA